MNALAKIPHHLHKYIVEQNYDRYTDEDQEVWRFVMRQLKSYLSKNAHEAYIQGLIETGISIGEIPRIDVMDQKLKAFGWRAVAVSGFIPPAAFMEFQSNGILPIACDMRTIEHILYTPAPDIVHEAAGHAPILIDPAFSKYLKSYAEVASLAIISSEDLNLYEAIRDLSDIKESPKSSKEEIAKAEQDLNSAISKMTYVSEAQLLGRMNWWTAEYGLIGDIRKPKIFGAGLLSSIDESRLFLKNPKLIKFDISCLDYTYDITELQPQLFVAENFQSLTEVINELAETLAFKHGGPEGLAKAKQAKTVCTIILNSKLSNEEFSYSGVLTDYTTVNQIITGLNFKGPVQIFKDEEITLVEDSPFYISFSAKSEFKVRSVHGGPKDLSKYPALDDFKASRVPDKLRTDYDLQKFEVYSMIRELRLKFDNDTFTKIKSLYFDKFVEEWLIGFNLLEQACLQEGKDADVVQLMNHFSQFESKSSVRKLCIDLGLNLLKKEGLLQ